MSSDRFENLSLSQPILRALSEEGYQRPTEIQRTAIPEVLEGKDLLATAQTGTGKTAAFALPMLQMLQERRPPSPKGIRALILTPTRELALQIEESIRGYGRHLRLRTAVVLGGVRAAPQIRALRSNPDFLIATPGRLLDLFDRGHVRLDRVEILVLDEADRMLDMGFVRDVRRIVSKTPAGRQTLFFSATLSAKIAQFASDMLRDPSIVQATPPASVSGNVEQKVLYVRQMHKHELLADILKDEKVRRALVFTRTKRQADRVVRALSADGISAGVIHSDKNQTQRQQALSAFDRGRLRVLVATDIVARGIDVEDITHVINYEMPNEPGNYVHRIGRTARAGAEGVALSFCDAMDIPMLRWIEKLTKVPLSAVEDHPFHATAIAGLHTRVPTTPSWMTAPRRGRRFGSRGRRRMIR
jgi:ATP-dependent RNA helicase RhlE